MTQKEINIIFCIILAFSVLGFILWDTQYHDFGIIITTLSGVAFLWWCFGIKKK